MVRYVRGQMSVKILDGVMAQSETRQSAYHIVIERPSGWRLLPLKEFWQYRDLLLHLVWRDLKVRYKQTILGASWAILQPFVTMVVFTVFFGNFARIPSDGIPYPIFSFAALVPWTFFASGVTAVSGSIVGNTGMIKKIYFPRLIFPISTLLSSLVDFVPAFLVLLLMIVGYIALTPVSVMDYLVPQVADVAVGVNLTLNIVWVVPLIMLAFVTALGIGLWLAALNVQFRDIRYATGFIIRMWMFITPIIYPVSMVDESFRTLYFLNPMAGVVEGFRWSLLGTSAAPGGEILLSAVVSVILLMSGLLYFNRMEQWFADVV